MNTKTYPLPGATKFEGRLSDEQAKAIAEEYYDLDQLAPGENCHHVKTISGWAASIGFVDGLPAILHKLPDGSRELETLQSTTVTKANGHLVWCKCGICR